MGPMLIFDKSTLQSLSIDESVWLENFFLTNVTPLFYVESLADLEKQVKEGRTPEQVVGSLAAKTPTNGAFSNSNYFELLVNDLCGNPVVMDKRPILRRVQPRRSPDGKIGFYYKQFPEEAALHRWEKREFLEVERHVAKKWRQVLSNLSFEQTMAMVWNIVPHGVDFSDAKDIKVFVDKFIEGNEKSVLDFAFIILDVPEKLRSTILQHWEKAGHPSFNKFAPYAAYVLSIDLLFYLALKKSFISKVRPSNKIDLAYLYYLPFCRVFSSSDNLHARIVPLFMTKGQLFIPGEDLKKGLKELDDYYSKLPEDVKKQGVMKFANYPPRDADTFMTRLWDTLSSTWRNDAKEKEEEKGLPSDEELLKQLIKHSEENSIPIEDGGNITSDEADHVTFQRFGVPKKGKWNIMPEGLGGKNE